MPLIALEEVGHLIRRHPRQTLLTQDVTSVMPEITHRLLKSLGVKSLWQVMTISEREFNQELEFLGTPIDETSAILDTIKDTLVNHGFKIRENTPYALRMPGDPTRYVKVITDSSNTLVPLYQDATYYWTRWAAMSAANRLSASFPKLQVVFRSEALKFGHAILL